MNCAVCEQRLRQDHDDIDWLEQNHDRIAVFPDINCVDGENERCWIVWLDGESPETYATLRQAIAAARKKEMKKR